MFDDDSLDQWPLTDGEYCSECGRSDCNGVNDPRFCEGEEDTLEEEDSYDYLDDLINNDEEEEDERLKRHRRPSSDYPE